MTRRFSGRSNFNVDGRADVLYQDTDSTTWRLITPAGSDYASSYAFVTGMAGPWALPN